jgi:hypothetical protein
VAPSPSPPASAPGILAPASSFGTYVVRDYATPPNSANGKLIARDRTGSYSCSATVVASRGRSVILTAGHCIHTRRGGWARRLKFIPAFHRGDAPYGRWSWHEMRIDRKWGLHQDSHYDYAAVSMRPKNGRSLQDAVGAYGFAWNQRANRSYRAFGYPANFFGTSRMVACYAPFVRRDSFPPRREPAPVGIRCKLGAGASGGGWLIQDREVASVTSYGYQGRNATYGPYFTGRTLRMLQEAERH